MNNSVSMLTQPKSEDSLTYQRYSTCGSGSTMDEEYIDACHSQSMIEENRNPQFVGGYRQDIQNYIEQQQSNYMIHLNYMESIQSDISAKMRTILIDWIEEVHLKFKLSQHTLHMTINLIDRFLQCCPIKRNRLQLLGVTSLFICAKYEEIYPPNIKDFVYVCDRAYTKEDLLRMEGQILRAIDFNLNFVSSLRFLEMKTIEKGFESTQIFQTYHFMLSCYLLEMSLHNYDFIHYSPQQMAHAASHLSNRLLGIADYSNDHQDQIVKLLHRQYVANQANSLYPAVKRKYAREEYLSVSTINYL